LGRRRIGHLSRVRIFSINARKRVELQNELAESARYARTIQTLTTQEVKALALMKAATAIANNTPIERLWKQGTAVELARGLRFALDVEVGAAKVASNSGRE
jgi:hypothetical protein